MSLALRQRRQHAARALAADARRQQVSWEDLVAWPDWTEWPDAERDALALKAGAWLHAAALRRCIVGAALQRARQHLGEAAFERLMSSTPGTDGADEALPVNGTSISAGALDTWLLAEGHEALLASVPSPVLRAPLRERLAPRSVAPLRPRAGARARAAVEEALR